MVHWLRHVVKKTVYVVCSTINRINLAAVHDGCIFCKLRRKHTKINKQEKKEEKYRKKNRNKTNETFQNFGWFFFTFWNCFVFFVFFFFVFVFAVRLHQLRKKNNIEYILKEKKNCFKCSIVSVCHSRCSLLNRGGVCRFSFCIFCCCFLQIHIVISKWSENINQVQSLLRSISLSITWLIWYIIMQY